MPVTARKIVELCVRLDVGDKGHWSFETAVPIDFNIGYRVGREAAVPAMQSRASTGNDALQVDVKEHCCLLRADLRQRTGLDLRPPTRASMLCRGAGARRCCRARHAAFGRPGACRGLPGPPRERDQKR